MTQPATEGAPMVRFGVNGQQHAVEACSRASLLTWLRNDLALNSPKYGCGLGECGACTVLVDGKAARSCAIPATGIAGRSVTTLEGLGNLKHPHPVQQAFIDEQAAQCGYCLSGMIMMTTALLLRNPDPSEAEIRRELSGNLCRCGTHVEIMRAVKRAAMLCRENGLQEQILKQKVPQAQSEPAPAAIDSIASRHRP